ncbi:MAG: ubiquinone biosynthesis protein COQ4 [Cyclobacteriaceae bacterium]|jgi:ubiquinone biosynthesis protein COQ4
MMSNKQSIKPIVAIKALKQLIANPEDTQKVFEVIDAMAGDSTRKSGQRFRASPSGQRILSRDASLLDTLVDRDRLQAMAPGSLGHAYLHFLDSEQLTADGLVEASDAARMNKHEDQALRRFETRQRDQHDLWHVTTGYGRNVAGEASLLAFTYAQTRNRGLGVIAIVGALKLSKNYGLSIFKSLWQGYRLGKAAAWLPQQEWETLLPLPLVQVRELLNVGTPSAYFALSSAPQAHLAQSV